MLVKTIIDSKNGKKWEVNKIDLTAAMGGTLPTYHPKLRTSGGGSTDTTNLIIIQKKGRER